MTGRLVAACGDPVSGLEPLGLTHRFPTAEVVAAADLDEIGLPRARARAVTGFAEAVATGAIDPATSRGLDETVAALRRLPGIGEWTAQYIAMRAGGERDAFLASDLGLRRALGTDPAARAERWRPWRAYGALHVWTHESDETSSALVAG